MIALAKDTREAIGAFADKVENRSLLFQKMVLAKNWGHESRFNDANRYNVLRACSSGDKLLSEDYRSAANRATKSGKNSNDYAYRAKVAGAMANVRVDNPDLVKRQIDNTLHMLVLLEKSYQGKSCVFVTQLGGRLLINMAGGVQENAGMSLDRCFGLPFIPGSAVKGVARNAALWDIRRTQDPNERKRKIQLALLSFGFIRNDIIKTSYWQGDFVWSADGDEELVRIAGDPFTQNDSFKGLLSFLPAYPSSTPEIVAEVLTPHPRADVAARGKGDPRPIFFPAVREGSAFGFAIINTWSPGEALALIEKVLDQAGKWLRQAVTEQGIGAKTGAGYGWFNIDPQAEEKRRTELDDFAHNVEKDRAKALAEIDAAAALAKAEADPAIMARLKALPPDRLRSVLNKYEFADHRFWPSSGEEADTVFQLSLVEMLLADDVLLSDMSSKAKGAKALKNLAIKFNRLLP